MDMLKKLSTVLKQKDTPPPRNRCSLKRVAADRCQGESREGNLGTRVCKSAEFEREITAFIRLVGNVLGLDYLRRRQKT